MDKIAVIEKWTESERGWGQRLDGVSIHLTKESYEAYVKKYLDEQPDKVPDEYSRPDGNLKVIKVSDELYKEIEESEGGLRLWRTAYNKLKKEGQIEFIL